MIPYLLELQPYIDIAILFDSKPVDELQTIDNKGQTFKKAFHKVNITPIVKNKFISIQKRHVPTSRGK